VPSNKPLKADRRQAVFAESLVAALLGGSLAVAANDLLMDDSLL
jgi:hypothetical protein